MSVATRVKKLEARGGSGEISPWSTRDFISAATVGRWSLIASASQEEMSGAPDKSTP